MKILLVEDDAKTADAVQSGLVAEGYETAVAGTGPEGLRRLRSQAFDLVILDWMLPGCDGIEVLTDLRRRGDKPPVLLLTAKDAIEDRVLGLDSGADDYLVKPFAFAELLARTRALLRRAGQEEALRLQVADLVLDLRTRLVRRGGGEVVLTPREFDLLRFLMSAEGQVVTRSMLAREIWRDANRSTPLDNVIDVHLARLRKKVDEGRPVRLIHTIRGVGFLCGVERFSPVDRSSA